MFSWVKAMDFCEKYHRGDVPLVPDIGGRHQSIYPITSNVIFDPTVKMVSARLPYCQDTVIQDTLEGARAPSQLREATVE